jgi:peptide methionine sulfoxide reductase MsrA
MEIRKLMNKLEKKIAYNVNNSNFTDSNSNNKILGTNKNLNNFINSANYSKNYLNSTTEDIYNTSLNGSVNHGSFKLIGDLKNVSLSNLYNKLNS